MTTKIPFSAVAVLCLALLPACAAAQQQRWDQYIADGLQALQQYSYGEAEKHFQAAVREAETLGPLKVARTLIYLGLAYEKQQREAEAEPLYSRALSIREKELGAEDLDVATAFEHYGRVLRKLGREADADEKTGRARTIRAEHIAESRKEPKPDPLRVGGSVAAPRVIERAEPQYSEEARIFRHQGSVELYLEVWPDGRAYNIQLRRALGLGLDEQAVEAVRQWRFQPGTKDGQPVTVGALVTIHFRLL